MYCLDHPNFMGTVYVNWSLPTQGGGMVAFSWKFKRLKQTLKNWNKEVFGNVFDAVKQAEDVLQLQSWIDYSQLSVDKEALHQAQVDLFSKLKTEEFFWRQKARCKLLEVRELNTKFFHASLVDKHSWLTLYRIKDSSGKWLETPNDIQAEAVSFLDSLFTDEGIDQDCLQR
ncbi:hypothetical protein ACH5RR_032566 [Cinchona calisaya]|uniref:Uncharacterized protein n=1 Tax=Cinchona calisaya TaxID=153742 RepID=A0ABD2YKY8_9GENT